MSFLKRAFLFKTTAIGIVITFITSFLPVQYKVRADDIDFSKPVCAYDLNHDGNIDQSEYANCTGQWSCPDPTVPCDPDTHKCTVKQPPICPDSTELDTQKDVCDAQPTVTCPDGYSWDRGLDLCTVQLSCPSGSVFVSDRDRCEISVTQTCPVGYQMDQAGQVCAKPVDCPSGSSYVPERDRCETAVMNSCPSGWVYVSSRNRCETPPQCPSPSVYSSAANKCVIDVTPTCPSGYEYNSTTDRCEASPECPGGTWNPVYRRCEASSTDYWTCSANGVQYSSQSSCQANCYGSSTSCGFSYSSSPYYFYAYNNTNTFGTWSQFDWDYNSCWLGSCSQPPDSFYYYTQSHISSVQSGNCTYYAGSYQTTNYWGVYYSICRTCTSQGSCSENHSCPSGYTWNGSVCVSSNPVCPNGGSYDAATGMCYITYRPSCPSGYSYDDTLNKCVTDPDCGSGFLDTVYDVCALSFSPSCPSGFSYDSSSNICYSAPICNGGVYNPSTKQCEASIIQQCPGGFSYDSSINVCYQSPSCPQGGTFNAQLDLCVQDPQHNCPAGTTYAVQDRLCEAVPQCNQGTYDPQTDMCELSADCQGKESCPLSPDVTCMTISMKDSVSSLNQFNTHEGNKGFYDDDGEVDQDGCNGNVFVFNGFPMECLTAGIQTGFHNCCSGSCDGKIDNYINQNIQSYGTLIDSTMVAKTIKAAIYAYQAYKAYKNGAFKYAVNYFKKDEAIASKASKPLSEDEKIKGQLHYFDTHPTLSPAEGVQKILTWSNVETMLMKSGELYLESVAVDFATNLAYKAFFGGCTAQDDLTVCYKNHGLCHYVGSYCKESWPAVGCVQRAKVYCCFNSKLARIVHEQGRPQLRSFGTSKLQMWGDPEDSPNCRGFTPQEFQMLDFSRIDLSEWYADINAKAQQKIQQNLQQNVQRFKTNLNSGGTH